MILREIDHSEYLEAIMKVFGWKLKSLELQFCKKIQLEHLASCTQLEKLKIMGGSILISSARNDPMIRWAPDTFLPLLKSFESDICLGVWAPIFEKKSTLINLELDCIHTGMPDVRIQFVLK